MILGHGSYPHYAGQHHARNHHMHGAHHGHPVHPGHFQERPFRSRGYQPIGLIVGLQNPEQQRPMVKVRLGLGIVLLTVAGVLIFCGILNFLGALEGEHFRVGSPMLGFGGVMFFAGLMFTIMARIRLKQLDQNQAADQDAWTPPEPCNADISHSPWNSEFNQSTSSVPYGQPPSNAPYGQSANSAPYGQPPSNAPYGQSANRAQSNWSYPSHPPPASLPPPYAYM